MRNDYNLSSQRFMTELDSPETHIYISTRGYRYKCISQFECHNTLLTFSYNVNILVDKVEHGADQFECICQVLHCVSDEKVPTMAYSKRIQIFYYCIALQYTISKSIWIDWTTWFNIVSILIWIYFTFKCKPASQIRGALYNASD